MNIYNLSTNYITKNSIKMFGNLENRMNVLKYGNNGGNRVINNSVVLLKIGDWIFVHGGLLPIHLENNTIRDINSKFYNQYYYNTSYNDSNLLFFDYDKSIFFNRIYSDNKNNKLAENNMNYLKKKYNIKGMVVGHRVQDNINEKNNVWRIVIGLSKAFGNQNNYLKIVLFVVSFVLLNINKCLDKPGDLRKSFLK